MSRHCQCDQPWLHGAHTTGRPCYLIEDAMTDTPRPDEAERQAADELSRLGQEMRLDAQCTCTPLPHGTGPEADCDVHGQPSVAYQQGYSDGHRHWSQIGNLDIAELRAERDRYRRSASDAAVELGVALAELEALRAGRASGATKWECQHGQPPQSCRLCEGIRQRQPFASVGHPNAPAPPPVSPVPEQGREELRQDDDGRRVAGIPTSIQHTAASRACGRHEPDQATAQPPGQPYSACWGPDVDQPEAGGPGERTGLNCQHCGKELIYEESLNIDKPPVKHRPEDEGGCVVGDPLAPIPVSVPVESRAVDVLRRLVELNDRPLTQASVGDWNAAWTEARALLGGAS